MEASLLWTRGSELYGTFGREVREAIVALKKFVAKKNEAENRLFDANSEPIMLQFTLRDIPAKRKHKPVLIKLANSLYTGRSVCIVVKDPQRTYKDLFEKHSPHPDYKVVGVGKLKTKYRRYDQRRELCDAHDVLLCDERVIEMMPQVLGKYGMDKKMPIPVPIAQQARDPSAPLVDAIASTVRGV